MRKNIYPIVLIISVIAFGAFLADLLLYKKNSKVIAVERGTSSTLEVQRHISVYLDSVIATATEISEILTREDSLNEWALKQLMKEKSHSPTFISGITVAYERNAFGLGVELFAPYYRLHEDDFVDIARVYDYTQDTLSTSIWYTRVVEENGSVWSEPYYAEGARMIVADYGVPFYHSPAKKRIRGVVSTTIPLRTFSRLVNAMNLGKAGYALMVSDSGSYLTHPVKGYVLQRNLFQEASDLEVEDEVAKIMSEPYGYIASSGISKGENMSLFFTEIPSTTWKLISVFILRDLIPEFDLVKRKTIHVWMASSLLLFVVLIGVFRINGLSDRELWMLSIFYSLIIIPNIVVVWNLNLDQELIQQPERELDIVSPDALQRYIDRQNRLLMQQEQDTFHTVPTGMYIDEMEFVDSYNLNISGTVWQRYPIDLLDEVSPGYYMPQISPFAEAAYSELVQTDTLEEEVVVIWRFRNTVRMRFDYSGFPFDLREVRLQLLPPEPHARILFVPDLGSYTILEPRLKPAINPDMVLPDANLVLSKFTFVQRSFQTTFGREDYAGYEGVPVMQFNILLKRRFINSFVTHVIPILVVAVLLFLVLFSSTKRRDSLSGISSLGGVETSAAFFFVLVLAHIDLRRTVSTPDISYMEIFYFLMYFMLGLVTINIVIFTKTERSTWFDIKDNFWVKLFYWPFLLTMILAFTLGYYY